MKALHITGFGDSEVIRRLVEPRDFDALVIANCHTVADAAEAYKGHHGSYPPDNDELKPFLPNGEWLTNPYTMQTNLPIRWGAATPGETDYGSIPGPGGQEFIGYNITGFGERERIYVISHNP